MGNQSSDCMEGQEEEEGNQIFEETEALNLTLSTFPSSNAPLPSTADPQFKRMRLLCLHGWRTNANILMMQSAAFRYHIGIEMHAVNAPWPADGPPDSLIAQIYSNQDYVQWYYRHDNEQGQPVRFEGVEESISALVKHVEEQGPFDGLLGFSQGAAVTTMLASRLLSDPNTVHKPKFAILIGGIQPMEIHHPKKPLQLPSLHIIGNADHLKHRSEALLQCYEDTPRIVLYHEEGHQIPSVRTNLYPSVKDWIEQFR